MKQLNELIIHFDPLERAIDAIARPVILAEFCCKHGSWRQQINKFRNNQAGPIVLLFMAWDVFWMIWMPSWQVVIFI